MNTYSWLKTVNVRSHDAGNAENVVICGAKSVKLICVCTCACINQQ